MAAGQRFAVAVAGVATVLWVGFAAAVLVTPSEAGANIGAGLIALLAIVVSISAAILLFTTTDSTPVRMASVASIGVWALFLVLAPTDAVPPVVLICLLAAGSAALVTSAALVVGRHHRQGLGR
jgi:hypothetical protein